MKNLGTVNKEEAQTELQQILGRKATTTELHLYAMFKHKPDYSFIKNEDGDLEAVHWTKDALK